jgi:hypothetical protein
MTGSPNDLPEDSQLDASRPDDEEQPPTPFDHPLFLPVLLLAGMIWFGYDGWLNQDPEMLEHQTFNRVGFGVLSVLTAWFGYRGVQDYRAERKTAAHEEVGSRPPSSS